MTTGTKSLLFGVHQVFLHPYFVWRAWKQLYGPADWRTLVCIVVHDWGYWGCELMDDTEGEQHPYFAAKIAGRLFGPKWYDFCLDHSRHLAKKNGRTPSKLCWADKVSMSHDPMWFYLFRARLSGELAEYRYNARQYVHPWLPDSVWFSWLRARMVRLAAEQKLETEHP